MDKRRGTEVRSFEQSVQGDRVRETGSNQFQQRDPGQGEAGASLSSPTPELRNSTVRQGSRPGRDWREETEV